jgi:uncharacterized protein with HEPN domain
MRDDRAKLFDILEAIQRIEKYAQLGRQAFEQDELVQTWMIHNLSVIGEASRALSAGLKDIHPKVPWSQIISLRNTIVHQYFDIDNDVVWNIIECDIPEFKQQIQAIIKK